MSTNTPFWGALLVAVLLPAAVQAQVPLPELPLSDAPDRDVIQFDVGAELAYHSNLFAVRNGPSDTLLRVPLGVSFDRVFSLQRIRLNAMVEPVKYFDFSRYDYIGYDVGALWDWELGRSLFGNVEASYSQTQTPFDSINFAQDNLENRLFLRALAGFRVTPNWAVFGAVDTQQLDNSAPLQRPNDYTFNSYEAGVRYAPGTGTLLDLFYRRTDGEYPDRQVYDSNGNLLPGAIDNNFSQNSYLIRMAYRPSDDSRISGYVGWTQRDFTNVSERNFSGPTGGLDVDWLWTGALQMKLRLLRDLYPDNSLAASYVEISRIALLPVIRYSGKLTFNPVLSWERRDYAGDPGFIITGAPARSDTLTRIGIGAEYEFMRNVFVNALFRSDHRNSNYDIFTYTDNVLSLGIRARF